MSGELKGSTPKSPFLKAVEAVEDGLLVVLLAGMIALAAVQILLRNILGSGLLWADPSLRVMVLWVGMIGAMVATRFDKQISVDAVSRFLSRRSKAALRVVTDLFTAGVSVAVGWNAWRLLRDDWAAGTTLFASVPMWVCELILPVSFTVIAVRYLIYAGHHLKEALGDRGDQ